MKIKAFLAKLLGIVPDVTEIRVIWPVPREMAWNPGCQTALKDFLNTEVGQQLIRHFEHWEVFQAGKSADQHVSESREWLAGKANGIRMARSMMLYLATPQENPVTDYDESLLEKILEERIRHHTRQNDEFILGAE
jgi:hypothetical protein